MYDFNGEGNIQGNFSHYVLLTDAPDTKIMGKLAQLITLTRYDNLCFEYENRIETELDILGFDGDILDQIFSRVLRKNLGRILTLSGNCIPQEDILCTLLERSLLEVQTTKIDLAQEIEKSHADEKI